jgi:hypothetical protein
VLVHSGELPGEADPFLDIPRLLENVRAVTVACPASGLMSVVRMDTAVVLPTPLRPSRPNGPFRHRKVKPLKSLDVPYC